LLNEDYSIAKIGDLGLSTVQHRRKIKSYGAGSYLWMAPEALLEQPHTEKVDVYSFGIVMWQVLHWNPDPFKKYLDMGDLNKLIEAICQRAERPDIDAEVHPSLKSIIELTWHQESRKRPSFSSILLLLDDALIKAVITDKDAAEFWRRHYGRVESGKQIETSKRVVPYETVAPAFFKALGEKFPSNPPDDKKYLCLKAIVSEKHPSYDMLVVLLEKFAAIFKWFGPMFPSNGDRFFDSMLNIVKEDWFHGDTSKDEAQALLSNFEKQHKHVENAFLVRFSTTDPITKNPFNISKISKAGSLVHQRVYFDAETNEHYITVKEKGESTRFASKEGIVGLIKLIMSNTKLLKIVVPRNKYHEIFNRQAHDEGYLDDDNE
jgi:serine/threonine protein kinase